MNRLKEFRESINLQQKDFAERIGINKTTYNNYERGTREPDGNFWATVAIEYGVSVDYLLGVSDTRDIKKSSTPVLETDVEDFSREVMATKLIDAMESSGFITPGADLTNEQLRKLKLIVDLLEELFNKD